MHVNESLPSLSSPSGLSPRIFSSHLSSLSLEGGGLPEGRKKALISSELWGQKINNRSCVREGGWGSGLGATPPACGEGGLASPRGLRLLLPWASQGQLLGNLSEATDKAFPVLLSPAKDKAQHGEFLSFSTLSGPASLGPGDRVSALKGSWPCHPLASSSQGARALLRIGSSSPPQLLLFLPRPLPCCSTKQKGQLGVSLRIRFMLTQCLQTNWSEALLSPGQGSESKAETSLLILRLWLSG